MDITATKIDEKKVADKRPACDKNINFDSDEHDIREKDVPKKRLWDDCAGLNAADTEKTSKLDGQKSQDSIPTWWNY